MVSFCFGWWIFMYNHIVLIYYYNILGLKEIIPQEMKNDILKKKLNSIRESIFMII